MEKVDEEVQWLVDTADLVPPRTDTGWWQDSKSGRKKKVTRDKGDK